MAVQPVTVPSPGESVTEGRVAKWYAADGAAVKVDDPLFELESDKAAQTVTAQAAGVLRVKVKEGETVAIGAVVGEIDTAAAVSREAKPSAPPAAAPKSVEQVPQAPAGGSQTRGADAPRSGGQGRACSSAPPAGRRRSPRRW